MILVTRIECPVKPMSANVLLRNTGAGGRRDSPRRRGARMSHRLKEPWLLWLPPPNWKQRHENRLRHIHITRIIHFRGREFDHENLALGYKGAIDLLVGRGWLKDDKPKWLTRRYDQVSWRRFGEEAHPLLSWDEREGGSIFEIFDYEPGEKPLR